MGQWGNGENGEMLYRYLDASELLENFSFYENQCKVLKLRKSEQGGGEEPLYSRDGGRQSQTEIIGHPIRKFERFSIFPSLATVVTAVAWSYIPLRIRMHYSDQCAWGHQKGVCRKSLILSDPWPGLTTGKCLDADRAEVIASWQFFNLLSFMRWHKPGKGLRGG